MNFLPEGYPFLVGMTLLAAVTFVLALRLRSWPLWLAAFGFVLLAIVVAWYFRDVASINAPTASSLLDRGPAGVAEMVTVVST